MVDFNVVVLLPAAGFGERMGTSTPKQYSSIAGQQVYIYTIKAFHRIPWIQNIIVCVSKENQSRTKAIIRDFGLTRVTVVAGGSSRHRSIRNGVQAVQTVCKRADVLLIHDGVRPLVDPQLVKDIATTANLHGVCGVVRPLVSTVISKDSDGFLESSLDRQKYCASEMPQGFQYRVIESAYEQCSDYDLDYGTECLHLAQKYTGVRAKLLDGPESLWKVTYKKDLHAAAGMLRETFISVGVLESLPNGFTKSLHEHLQCQGDQIMQLSNLPTSTDTLNSFVMIHSTEDTLDDVTHAVIALWRERHLAKQMLSTFVLVHIVRSDNAEQCHGTEVRLRTMTKLLSSHGHSDGVYVYTILTKAQISDYTSLSQMTASLIWERNECFSGQLFIVDS